MKVLFTICNYNANRQGALEKSIDKLRKLKTDDCRIAYWDNNSKDDSQDVLYAAKKEGLIDLLTLSSVNVGKAVAMNRMLYNSANTFDMINDDLMVSMDSDILICKPDFIETLSIVFNRSDIKMLTHSLYTDDTFEHEWVDNDVKMSGEEVIAGSRYGIISSPHNVGGGLLTMRIGEFISLGCYSENLGHNGKGAVYGGDDAMLILKAFKEFNGFKMIHSLDKYVVHMDSTDFEYKKWKQSCTKTMCEKGFGSIDIPSRGFYD